MLFLCMCLNLFSQVAQKNYCHSKKMLCQKNLLKRLLVDLLRDGHVWPDKPRMTNGHNVHYALPPQHPNVQSKKVEKNGFNMKTDCLVCCPGIPKTVTLDVLFSLR